MKVSNPLTIIAIFSGIAETLATVALIKLPLEIQSIFVYFVMAFPAAIVLLFFFVLYFKNTVLYAPSDFENQSHYLEANQIKENVSLQLEKIFASLNDKGKALSQAELDRAKSTLNHSVDTIVKLSPGERKVYSVLNESPRKISEISDELGIHISTATKYLSAMKKRGVVKVGDDGVSVELVV